MKTLVECLLEYDTTLLRAIAERWGVEPSTSRQQDMALEIAQALLNPDLVSETLTWLNDDERRAMDVLLANGGRMRAHRFTLEFGEVRRFGPGSLARHAPWRSPISPAEGLWYRALIARSFADDSGTVVEFFFIPSDLLPLVPASREMRRPFEIPGAEDPGRVEAGDLAAIDDMCSLLALAREGALRARDGRLVPETLDRLQAQLLRGGEERLAFLEHLARSAGFLRAEGRRLVLNREPVQDWLGRSRPQQLGALQSAWLDDPDWNDLCHVPGLRCEDTGWRSDPLRIRRAILDLLRHARLDAWLLIPGLVEAVRKQFPDYARPDGDFESWYIRDARSGEYLTGFEHWDRIEGALLVYLLGGPLHWLGGVTLGYQEGWEKPSMFRITPWGATWLGLTDAFPEGLAPQPARVTPDGTVILARELPLSDRFQLARIAEWRRSGPEYVYAITPSSLGHALSAGIRVQQIERFLQRISKDRVPAAAIALIRSWAERYGNVRLRRVAIVETRSAQGMNELLKHERIRGYLRQRLSPTSALIRESDWPFLIQELYRAGYLPEIIER
jgi:hypothetical protein